MQQNKQNPIGSTNQDSYQYVGPYRLEKTLGKGQTGEFPSDFFFFTVTL